ncbi:MAG: hypothetical protein WCA35_08120, partial [Kovacikia sp.]
VSTVRLYSPTPFSANLVMEPLIDQAIGRGAEGFGDRGSPGRLPHFSIKRWNFWPGTKGLHSPIYTLYSGLYWGEVQNCEGQGV